MEIHFLPVLVCAILSMILGALWYGPIFGKQWSHLIGVSHEDMKNAEHRKKMQKQAQPFYFFQFILSLIQLYVLAQYIQVWNGASGMLNALLIWLAFVMPTTAGACMWNNDSQKTKINKFLIQAGYQLVAFAIFGLILSSWR